MKRSIEFLALLLLLSMMFGTASGQTWEKAEKIDPLRGTPVATFRLAGKFLTPPHDSRPDAYPSMVAICEPGNHRYGNGKLHGKILKAYIDVGAVLDATVQYDLTTRVKVQFRLDDGKLQTDNWSVSNDYSALFYNPYDPGGDFANLLYAHSLPHKENTSPPVKKVVIGIPPYRGGEVVVQFDMPDPTEVADTCGLLVHKD